jgi:methylated-DNA-[protein]-cysteine S-methyltransferase
VHEDALVEDKKRPAASLKQVREYFEGKRNDFDLPLSADGTPFQRRVWDALCTIPHGETRSYGWLAKQVGSSPRAVGGANGSNPISLIVPCHRVIGADGSLTGFGWGVDVKKNLLDFESQQKTLA